MKFDLKFEIRIQYFWSNSELFRVEFEIRPSLNNTVKFRYRMSILVRISNHDGARAGISISELGLPRVH